jgi:mannitol-specific phosphotransferase system IIBC component
MKRTDIAMIILIAAFSVGLAYFVAKGVLGSMTEQTVKVKTIDPITSAIEQPNPKVFNENAINPSVEVNITTTTDVTQPAKTP